MSRHYIFAGGGTGGHLYPAIAVADKLKQTDDDCNITFYCSNRAIDSRILTKSGYNFKTIEAEGFSFKPNKLIKFIKAARLSREIIKKQLIGNDHAVVISCGGFVSYPVLLAAKELELPIFMLNVDFVPGKANKFLAKYTEQIFVQFSETADKFGKYKNKVLVTGCPLRESFESPDKSKAISDLGLDSSKKLLVITGASSGSANINNSISDIVDKLGKFSESWQIVHIAGVEHYQVMQEIYKGAKIKSIVLDFYDEMASLLGNADLIVGRSGAVSVAEYAACGAAAVCIPYPYHKDNHQQLNAQKLVEAGCGVIVLDNCDSKLNAQALLPVLMDFMDNEGKRLAAKAAAAKIAKLDAAKVIAEKIIKK